MSQPSTPVLADPMAEAEPSRRLRVMPWMVLLAFCVGAVGVTGMAFALVKPEQVTQPNAAGKSSSPPPSTVTTTPREPVFPTLQLTKPSRLLGFPELDTDLAVELGDSIEANMRTATDAGLVLEEVITGVYGNEKKRQIRAFGAIKADIADPKMYLMMQIASRKNWGFEQVIGIPNIEGSPYSATSCLDAMQGRTPIAICLWADERTYGMVLFFNQRAKEVKTTFEQARKQIEILA